MTTIPASTLVDTEPSVLSAGGSAININGLVLTKSTRVPIGSVLSFPSGDAVGNYFGLSSPQAATAAVYFAGFDGSSVKPGAQLWAQYPFTAVAAYVRGGNISAVPLATLQGYSGTLSVTIDGVLKTSAVNLAAATSFSNAAEIIANDLAIEGVQAGSVTGSIGGTLTCTSTGTTLNVTAVVTGSLQAGDAVSGTDSTNSLPGGCTIVSQLTGTPGGVGTYKLSGAASPGNLTSCTVTAVSTTLNVTAVGSGALGVADVLSGAGVTSGTYVTSIISGSGGIGLYGISAGQRVASEAITAFTPAVQYDSVSGAFIILSGTVGPGSTITFGSGAMASLLLLTQVTGAVLSQGAAAATPAAFMNALIGVNKNWVTFMTDFDPDAGSGNTQKQAFAAWKNTQNNRFGYVCWDTDITPTQNVPAVTSLGFILANNNDSGTCLIYESSDLKLAAFICGAAASIDFAEKNGRITFAYKQQAGLSASVTDETTAFNLGGNPQASDRGNGYNYYGAFAEADSSFVWFQRGFTTGDFAWFDSYINQIWLNSAFRAALLNYLGNAKSSPYDDAGNTLIEQTLADPIAAGLNFGAFAPGPISAGQAAQVNAQAGANIANTLQTQGWYLQILPASSTVRAARTSPPCKFWYLDRGSVQAITLGSIAVQ